jgi:hypothetical protein
LSTAPPIRARRRPWVGPLVGLVSLIATAAVLELGFRLLQAPLGVDRKELEVARGIVRDRLAFNYIPRPHYGWSIPPSSQQRNRYGFYGDDWALERKPGVLRIACLGGSTTAGGNRRGDRGAYPHFLRAELEQRIGLEVEVMNCGISGWTTAEMVCAWFLLLQDFKPDLVILHEVVNDVDPRTYPGFRADYAHWRSTWSITPHPAPLRWLVGQSDLAAWWLGRSPPTLRDATVLAAPAELTV